MTTLIIQFGFYLVVGGLSAVVDVGLFWQLVLAGFPIMYASVTSFIIATFVNYFLSYTLAFVRGRYSLHAEFVRFWLVSLIGLGLNTFVVWMLLRLFVGPLASKIIALPVVLAWNFLGRRLFVFHKDKIPLPVDSVRTLVEKAIAGKRQ